jgi:transcriptional regulator of arginine metabolism
MNNHAVRWITIQMSKPARQEAILGLVAQQRIASQDELQRALRGRGFAAGQATLSRDIHELGLVKTEEGYAVRQGGGPEAVLPPVARLVREFVLDVQAAQNLLVLRTSVGSAQPVAAALDSQKWHEQIGSIGGDDTILIVCVDKRSASSLGKRIERMLA